MSATFRSKTEGTNTSATTFTFDVPAGTVEGDFLFAEFALDIQAPTGVALTGGSDWTLLDSPACSGDGGSIWYYYKIAGASEPSTYQFTYTGAATRCAYACAAYEGVDTTTPIAASLVTNPNLGTPPSSPVSMAASAITTTADNQTVIYGGFVDWDNQVACAFTAPTELGGFTERAKQTPASFVNCVLYDGVKTTTGSTGTVTAVGTLTGAFGNYIAVLIALNDAVPSSGQTSYPDADGTDGAWTPSTGTDLHAVIADATDTEWIATDSNSTCRGGMAALDTPVAGTQTFAFRASGSPAKKLIATLIEGASTSRGTVTVDPLTSTATGYSFEPSGISNYADLDWQFEIADATSPPTPSVSFGAIGTGVNGSTSINVGVPSGIVAGNYLLLHVTSGATNSETPNTPSGWTLLATGASTDGTFGVDTGPRRATVFGKVAGASEGAVTVTTTNGNTVRGTMSRWSLGHAGYSWDVVAQGANDSTSGTGVSMTTAAIDWAAGDCAAVVVGQRVDAATQSAQSLTASGTTFGTRTNRATTAVTTGNDHRHVVDTFAAVTTGGGSAATTWAYTASASVSAGGVVVRLREVPPTEFGRVYTTKLTIPEADTGGAQSLSPSLVTNTVTFYGATVTTGAVTITPSVVTNAQTFYGPTLSASYSLTPSKYENSQTFYAPTVLRGAVTLAPALLSNTQTFPAAAVSRGAVSLAPGLVQNTQTFYGATVSQSAPAQELLPARLVNAQVFYSPVVAAGAVALTPALFTNTQVFYGPTVAAGAPAQELFPALLANTQTFYAAGIASTYTLTPSVVENTSVFFSPVVTQPQAQELLPSLFSNTQVFYPAVLAEVRSTAFGGWWGRQPYTQRRAKTKQEREEERRRLGITPEPAGIIETAPVTAPSKAYRRVVDRLLSNLPQRSVDAVKTYALPDTRRETTMRPDEPVAVVGVEQIAAQKRAIFERDLVYIVATLIS